MAKVTAGRNELGTFAPQFAELNDDVLFGQVWSREDKLSARDRSIVTVTALMASGILDNSLKFHLQNAKKSWSDTRRNCRNFNTCCIFMQAGLRLGQRFV